MQPNEDITIEPKDIIHLEDYLSHPKEDLAQQSIIGNKSESSSDSDDEDCDIKITLKPQRPWSSYTQEELDELEKKYGECDYCYSLQLPEHMYKGHYSESCPKLKKMRCDRCAIFGHTGGHCPTKTKKLEIKCTFCFRGGKAESKYNSHTTDSCIDKREYHGEYQDTRCNYKKRQDYREGSNYRSNDYYYQSRPVQNTSKASGGYQSNYEEFPKLSKKK
jgi:hypothetical protein